MHVCMRMYTKKHTTTQTHKLRNMHAHNHANTHTPAHPDTNKQNTDTRTNPHMHTPTPTPTPTHTDTYTHTDTDTDTDTDTHNTHTHTQTHKHKHRHKHKHKHIHKHIIRREGANRDPAPHRHSRVRGPSPGAARERRLHRPACCCDLVRGAATRRFGMPRAFGTTRPASSEHRVQVRSKQGGPDLPIINAWTPWCSVAGQDKAQLSCRAQGSNLSRGRVATIAPRPLDAGHLLAQGTATTRFGAPWPAGFGQPRPNGSR